MVRSSYPSHWTCGHIVKKCSLISVVPVSRPTMHSLSHSMVNFVQSVSISSGSCRWRRPQKSSKLGGTITTIVAPFGVRERIASRVQGSASKRPSPLARDPEKLTLRMDQRWGQVHEAVNSQNIWTSFWVALHRPPLPQFCPIPETPLREIADSEHGELCPHKAHLLR